MQQNAQIMTNATKCTNNNNCNMLEDFIIPEINQVNKDHVIFMQDGAPPHYANIFRIFWTTLSQQGGLDAEDHTTGQHAVLTPLHVISFYGLGERSGLQTWTTNNRRARWCHTWCDIKCPSRIFKESCYRRGTTALTKAHRKWRWLCGSVITNRQDGSYVMSTDKC